MLENSIEKHGKKEAERLGYLAFKLRFISYTGAPDHLFISKEGTVVFIEFKRPGKTERKRQGFVHTLLKQWKQKVYVLDSKKETTRILELYTS